MRFRSRPSSRQGHGPGQVTRVELKETMMTAQRLYESGFITYMRTDGIDMAPEAANEVRNLIVEMYGERYAPKNPRIYKNASKNAQEAHECIRPTDIRISPKKALEAIESNGGRHLVNINN